MTPSILKPGVLASMPKSQPSFAGAELPAAPMAAPDLAPVATTMDKKQGFGSKAMEFLKKPGMQDALLAYAGATLGGRSIGDGILAGMTASNTARSRISDAADKDRDFGLKERGVSAQERNIDANISQGNRKLDIDEELGRADIDLKNRGLNETITARREGNKIKYFDIATGKEIAMANMANQAAMNAADNATSSSNNAASNQAAITVAGIRGVGSQDDPDRPSLKAAGGILDGVLPSFVPKGVDQAEWAAAIQQNPELYGQLVDAAGAAYGTGGMQGAQGAVRGILDGYEYKGSGWMDGDPRFEQRASPAAAPGVAPRNASPTAPTELRYDAKGNAYRRGPNGEAVLVRKGA